MPSASAPSRAVLSVSSTSVGPGTRHPGTLTARGNLARWLGVAGQADHAAAQYRDLLTDRLRVLGPDHSDTLTTRGNLAHWLGVAGSPTRTPPRTATCSPTGCGSWDPITLTPSPLGSSWPRSGFVAGPRLLSVGRLGAEFARQHIARGADHRSL